MSSARIKRLGERVEHGRIFRVAQYTTEDDDEMLVNAIARILRCSQSYRLFYGLF